MSSSRLLSPLYLLSLSLLFQVAIGENPISYTCYSSGNFTTPNGAYNNKNLLTILDYTTPITGFAFSLLGQRKDIVSYGLGLCRGDINATLCQACVKNATNEIQTVCPFKNKAIIWYDYCQVKYSSLDFLGLASTQVWYLLENTASASDPVSFNKTVVQFVGQLKEKAANSSKLYASGDLGIGNSTTLYGLVQCTRDISFVSCVDCIDYAIKIVSQDAYAKKGARFFGESCDIRYELYPFVLG